MAQANIKERIKEMRLRVLAEPLGEAAAQMEGIKSLEDEILKDDILEEKNVEDDFEAFADNPKTNNSVREKKTKTKTAKKLKSGKKKTSKNSKMQELEETAEIVEKTLQLESNEKIDGKVEEIGEADINSQTGSKETLGKNEPSANVNALDEHKKPSNEIIDLTDKWVELEVRSRLSGLEKQEKQTRAMLKEIVEILDRIETPKISNQTLPTVSEKKAEPISSNSQMSQIKKRHWVDIVKRIFVVIGTFAIFAGLIWGISLYLFFDI